MLIKLVRFTLLVAVGLTAASCGAPRRERITGNPMHIDNVYAAVPAEGSSDSTLSSASVKLPFPEVSVTLKPSEFGSNFANGVNFSPLEKPSAGTADVYVNPCYDHAKVINVLLIPPDNPLEKL